MQAHFTAFLRTKARCLSCWRFFSNQARHTIKSSGFAPPAGAPAKRLVWDISQHFLTTVGLRGKGGRQPVLDQEAGREGEIARSLERRHHEGESSRRIRTLPGECF